MYNPGAAPTSAAYYGPRFDYDPATLAPKGLLMEEQRTNLYTQSEFESGLSGAVGLVTSSTMTGPFGTTINAAAYGHDGSTASYLYKGTVIASTTYTLSVFVRMDDGGAPSFGSTNGSSVTNDFALIIAGGIATATDYVVQNFGNGLYRVSGTITTGATNLSNNGVLKYATNSSRTFKTSAWQLEAGSFATSYIPTVASQVTRSTDNASMTGENFSSWYNATEGSFFAQFQTLYSTTADVSRGLLSGDGSGNKRYLYIGAGSSNIASYDGTLVLNSLADITGPVAKACSAYDATNRFLCSQGGSVGTATVAAGYPATTNIDIGNFGGIGGNVFCGHIRRIMYYNTRLSNAQLQALTS